MWLSIVQMLLKLWQAWHAAPASQVKPMNMSVFSAGKMEKTLTLAVQTIEPLKVALKFAFSGGLAVGWYCFLGILGLYLLLSLLDYCPGICEEMGAHHVCTWAGSSHPSTCWRGMGIKNELAWPFQAHFLCLKLGQIAISEAKNNKFL